MADLILVVLFILLIAILWLFFKSRHLRNKAYMVLILFLVIFLYLSIVNVIKENNVNVGSFEGIVTAGKFYFIWLGHVFDNTKTLISNVIKMNWGMNSTG